MTNIFTMKSWSPYVVGIGLGVLSWFAFATADKHLAITLQYEHIAAMAQMFFAPGAAATNRYYTVRAQAGLEPKIGWYLMLLVGVFIGALLSSWLSGDRTRTSVSPLWRWRFGDSTVKRFAAAFAGRALFEGGNPYKSKAYVRAAASLRRLARPLPDLIKEGRLQTIPGVGAAIAKRIEGLHRAGTDASLERMRGKLPAGVLPLLAIPGLRPATILKLHKLLDVNSMGDLAAAVRNGKVASTKGLGAALERKIAQGMAIASESAGRLRMNQAQAVLDHAIDELQALRPELQSITTAGDLRRCCELVADVRLVAIDPQAHGLSEERFGAAALHVSPPSQFGNALLFATGSTRHLDQLQAIARKKGLTLSADGLRRGLKVLAARREEDIYKRLGLQFIPPELREGADEIACEGGKAAAIGQHEGPARRPSPAHGLSDGVNTLEEMAEAARDRGYSYLGVADHSQPAHYAGGLSLEEIETQYAMADALNRRYRGGFRILKGIESDILADGSLDYPPEVLRRFDFVVASVHSRFRLGRAEQTKRILAAVSNPYTTILGHLTGRQLRRRPGYEVDVEAILKACARHGVAVEINGNPYRVELDWRWHQKAVQLGCLLSINPDAHSIAELDLVKWGVAVIRKGGVPKPRVLNAMSLKQIIAHLARRRNRHSVRKRAVDSRERVAALAVVRGRHPGGGSSKHQGE